MIERKNKLLFFIENNNNIKQLNKIINKITYLYKNSYKHELEDINQEVITNILSFCNEKNINIEDLNKKELKAINRFLKRTIQFKINDNLYSFVINIDGKNERIYIKSDNHIPLDNFNIEQEKQKKDYYNYYNELIENLSLNREELDFLDSFLKNKGVSKEIQKDLQITQPKFYKLKKNIMNKVNNEKSYTVRYTQLLNDKKIIEYYLEVDDLKTLKTELSSLVINNIDISKINKDEDFKKELKKFIKMVENYKEKYKKTFRKDYSLNEHIKKIKKEYKDVKIFKVNTNGIIIDWD